MCLCMLPTIFARANNNILEMYKFNEKKKAENQFMFM